MSHERFSSINDPYIATSLAHCTSKQSSRDLIWICWIWFDLFQMFSDVSTLHPGRSSSQSFKLESWLARFAAELEGDREKGAPTGFPWFHRHQLVMYHGVPPRWFMENPQKWMGVLWIGNLQLGSISQDLPANLVSQSSSYLEILSKLRLWSKKWHARFQFHKLSTVQLAANHLIRSWGCLFPPVFRGW